MYNLTSDFEYWNRGDITPATFVYNPTTNKIYVWQDPSVGLVELNPEMQAALQSGQLTVKDGQIYDTTTGLTAGRLKTTSQLEGYGLPTTITTTYSAPTPAPTTSTSSTPTITVPPLPATTTTPVPTATTSAGTITTTPTITVPTTGATTTNIPTITNPLAGATTPTTTNLDLIRAQVASLEAAGTLSPDQQATLDSARQLLVQSAIGPGGDAIAQQEYLNRLSAAAALSGRAREAYNLALRLATTEKETGVRRAEADAYNAAMRAVAGLGARGISGMGGLKTAAQRAASSEPLQKRMDALNAYLGKTSAASLLLEEEKAKALQARQDAQTAMLRANKIASDLAAGATGTATSTTQLIPTITNPLALSQTTQQNLNLLPPTIQVPKL